MGIKEELIKSAFSEMIIDQIQSVNFDADAIANTLAINMLGEIQTVLTDNPLEKDDFQRIEEIVSIFEKYHISTGACHDFS